jgi:hypothetical protein
MHADDAYVGTCIADRRKAGQLLGRMPDRGRCAICGGLHDNSFPPSGGCDNELSSNGIFDDASLNPVNFSHTEKRWKMISADHSLSRRVMIFNEINGLFH